MESRQRLNHVEGGESIESGPVAARMKGSLFTALKLTAALAQLRDADAQALSHNFELCPANALGIDDDGDIRAIGIIGLENRSRLQPQEIANGKGMHG
jgi:hypothetical protein